MGFGEINAVDRRIPSVRGGVLLLDR